MLVLDLPARDSICFAAKTNDREASLARILIVDDHPSVISGCRALLGAESGVEVIDAPDGAAGFAAFFKAKPRLAETPVST